MTLKEISLLLEPMKETIKSISFNHENEAVLFTDRDNIHKLSLYLFRDLNAALYTVVCTDEREKHDCFKIKYIYSYPKDDLFIILSIEAKENFLSMSEDIPALNWYEREIHDLFGLHPDGHPDLRPLMKYPENFPYDAYPLRKDYPTDKRPEFKAYGSYPYKPIEGDGVYQVLVGPIHAGVIEPGHFRFSMAGEPMLRLEIRHFWKHRGIEKLSENKNIEDALTLAEKISGDHCFAHSLAFVQAAEKLCETTVPKRAQYIRLIFAEIERMICNISDFAGVLQDIGFSFGTQGILVLKEELMRMNKEISGHRFNKGVLTIGGVNVDINDQSCTIIRNKLLDIRKRYFEFKEILTSSASILERFESTGIIDKDVIKDLSALGYTSRASGIASDTRMEHPYLMYDKLDTESKVVLEGDVYARLRIKLADIENGFSLIFEAIRQLPDTDIFTKVDQVKPDSWALGYSEGQRGNIIHYLQTDENGKIFRWKVRDPSFNNWQTIQFAISHDIIADFPVINKSLSLSYAGNDL